MIKLETIQRATEWATANLSDAHILQFNDDHRVPSPDGESGIVIHIDSDSAGMRYISDRNLSVTVTVTNDGWYKKHITDVAPGIRVIVLVPR